METASCWLILDKRGTNVPLKCITPAELVLLVRDRQDFVGRHPVHNLVITGKSRRSDVMEKQRLRETYGGSLADRTKAKIDVLYPGVGVALPQDFASLGDVYKLSLRKDSELEQPAADIPGIGNSEMERIMRLEELELASEDGSLAETDREELTKLREFFASKREDEEASTETEKAAA